MKPAQSRARRRAAPAPPRILLLLPLVLAVSAIYLVHNRANVFPPRSAVQNSLTTLSKRSDPGAHDPYAHDVPCYIPYHQIYAKLPPWLGIALLVLWLMFLFSFLGIVASDFFCPNLSTLASRLGLPEDVAGATMVGWANGAPDLFSTFASIKAGSGSLAIGELIGAASFICSVVAGSMVLVKPFKVSKFNFFRDVGFFTVAVAFALNILRDGKISAWEANLMIVLYVVYVVFVAVASYWRRRRRRQKDKERMIRQAWDDRVPDVTISDASRQEHADLVDLERSHDRQTPHGPRRTQSLSPLVIPSLQVTQGEDYFTSPAPVSSQQSAVTPQADIAFPSPGMISISSGRRRATSVTSPSGRHTPTNAFPTGSRHHAHSSGHARSTSQHAIHMQGRMSLLGAVEFRDVVNSLHADSSTSKHLAGFEFPPSGPASSTSSIGRGQRGHRRTRSGRRRGSSSEPEEGLDMAGSPRPRPSRPGTYHGNGHEPELLPESRRRAISGPAEPEGAFVRSSNNLLDVDDPWKNAPTPESRSRGPSLSVQQSAEAVIPDWSIPAGDLEGTESTAGDSDVTARPLDAASSVGTSRANPNRALSHFPSKALKVLGLSGSEAPERGIPPKAQRLLGTTTDMSPTKARISLRGILHIGGALVYALFPTLHHFRHKGILNMITSIISTPAVLLLNLTLPVVDESVPADDFIEQMEKEHLESELIDEEGAIRLSSDDEDEGDDDNSEASIRDLRQRQNELDLEARERPESALDETEREERLEQLRVQIARAQEIHSPVATRLHHSHSNMQSRSNSDPEHAHSHHLTTAGGHLAVPGATITTNVHSIDTEDEAAVENTVVNNVAVGVASLPALEGDRDLRLGNGAEFCDEHQLARCLTAIQCLLAPIFAVAALFGDDLEIWYLPAATGVGLALSAISLIFFTDLEHVTRVLTLCVIGFVIAVVWILTIVNEVVGVLQTIGHILSLSDAILGLTIFAMGNSLGDLVANVTVARMGYPLMALSACFGGPMLNILLGIGFSGTYMTAITHQPVIIKMNTTLFVSGISLLAVLLTTLISVPLNGFVMSRRWAYGIMLIYLTVMTANVVVEVRSTK